MKLLDNVAGSSNFIYVHTSILFQKKSGRSFPQETGLLPGEKQRSFQKYA